MDMTGQLIPLDEQERKLFALLQIPIKTLGSEGLDLLRDKWRGVLDKEEPEAHEALQRAGLSTDDLSDYSILFEAVDIFLKRKKPFLNRLAGESDLGERIQLIGSPVLRAVFLHKTNHESLKGMYSLYLWWNRASGERFLGRSDNLGKLLELLRAGVELTQANRESVQLKYRAEARIQGESTVWMTVHAGERVAEDFENEAISYSAAEPVLLNFATSAEDEHVVLEVRTARKKIIAPLIQWLNDHNSGLFTAVPETTEALTEERQQEILRALGEWIPHADLTLSAISFASTALPGTPKMSLTESSPAGIGSAVRHLTTTDLPMLDGLSLSDVESFSVRWGKRRQRTVRRRVIDALTLVFYIQDAEMAREEAQQLAELIESVFQVPIGKSLSVRELRGSRSLLIDHIVSQSTDENLSAIEQLTLEELQSAGFIEAEQVREYRCPHCGTRSEDTECQNCMEPGTEILFRSLRADVNRLREFVAASLGNTKTHVITVGRDTLQYVEYRHNDYPVRVFALTEPPTRTMIQRLHADLVPVVYVIMGRIGVVQQVVTSDRSAVMLSFGYLWDSQGAVAERLVGAIDEANRLMDVQREQAIHEAYRRLTAGSYGQDNQAFERDCFLLLLRFFPNGFKLGGVAKRRPDGIYVSTGTIGGRRAVSIYSMDAKWSEGRVDLNSYEKLKAANYVNNIASLPETRDYSSPTAHILVGPGFSDGGLNHTYTLLKQQNPGWPGNLVAIDTAALLQLVESYHTDRERWITRHESFALNFDRVVGNTQTHHITEREMAELIDRVLRGTSDVGQPTARALGRALDEV